MNGSGDIAGIISKLTEDPEMMKSLMGIAGGLMKGEGGGASEHVSGEKPPNRGEGVELDSVRSSAEAGNRECRKDVCGEKGGKGGAFRGDDAENLIRLLIALKPYVGKERCSKIDSIVKILKLVRLSEQTGLLKSLL